MLLRRGGGGAPACGNATGSDWFDSYDDYVFAECLVLCCIVVWAIIFEECHHFAVHFLHAHLHYDVRHVYKDDLDLRQSTVDYEAARESQQNAQSDELNRNTTFIDMIDNEITGAARMTEVESDFREEAGIATGAEKKASHDQDATHLVFGATSHFDHLIERANAEFMVLGFLAFLIWSIEQAKGFDTLESWFGGPSATELYHLFEAVHMYLFLAMCLNFVMAAMLIHRCAKYQVRFAYIERPGNDTGTNQFDFNLRTSRENITVEMTAEMEQQAAFTLPWFLRDGTHGVATWSGIKDVFVYCSNQRADPSRTSEAEAPQTIHSNFDFARYISVCLDGVIADVITFSEVTWTFVLLIYLGHSIPSGFLDYAKVGTISGIEVQLAVIAGFVPVTAYLIIRSSTQDLKLMVNGAQQEPPHMEVRESWLKTICGWTDESMDAASFETYVARMLQALMFVLCYSVARLLASKEFWTADGKNDIEEVCLFIYYLFLLFFTGAVLIPEAVVTSSVAFCMPPYVDNHDWECALACQRHADKLAEIGLWRERTSTVTPTKPLELEVPGVKGGVLEGADRGCGRGC